MVDQSNTGSSKSSAPTIYSLGIVLLVLAALILLVNLVLGKFSESTEVVAVHGVIVTPIVTIGAAAFGISTAATKGAEAGAAAGAACKEAAEKETAKVKAAAQRVLPEFEAVREKVGGFLAKFEGAGSSAAGQRAVKFGLMDDGEEAPPPILEVPLSELGEIREGMARVEGALGEFSED